MSEACMRCAAVAPDRAALAAHADEAGHPVCCVCARSLRQEESGTCVPCRDRAWADLDAIRRGYSDLPRMLGHPASPVVDRAGGASAERPVVGGDVLVLLGPGSDGAQAGGYVHAADNAPYDPPSVAHELARWEDVWRREFGHGASATTGSVKDACRYLTKHLEWAATYLDGALFAAFASEVRALRRRIDNALALEPRPVRGAPCLDCDPPVELEQQWTDAGRDDHWTCPRCGRRYEPDRYRLAVAAQLCWQRQQEGAPA